MDSKPVYRTTNARRAAVEDMNIDHRCLDVAMAQELLYHSNIVPSFEQVSEVINGSWNLFQLSSESGGSVLLQCSQVGLSSSMGSSM